MNQFQASNVIEIFFWTFSYNEFINMIT